MREKVVEKVIMMIEIGDEEVVVMREICGVKIVVMCFIFCKMKG